MRTEPLSFVSLVILGSVFLGAESTFGQVSGESIFDAYDDTLRLYTVEPRKLVPFCEREGRVDSVTRVPVVLNLDEYSGLLEVTDVARVEGPVTRGEIILTVDRRRIDRMIIDVRAALESARRRLSILEDQQRILVERNATRIERLEREKEQAERDLVTFDEYEGPRLLKTAELTVQDRENSTAKKREHLRELEVIYDDPDVGGERSEMVLDRARRNVAIAESLLQLARKERELVEKIRIPERELALKDKVRWAIERLSREKEKNRLSESTKKDAVGTAERAVHELEARLSRLESDRERLTVTAPRDGMLAPLEAKVGDLVTPRISLTEIYDPQNLVVRLEATAEDLRILTLGKPVSINLSDYREVTLAGSVAKIGDLGNPLGDETWFPVTIRIDGSHPLLRIGLRSFVSAEGTPVENVLTVPREAIYRHRGRPVVRVWKDGIRSIQDVILGPGNLDSVQVLEGVVAGQQVILPRIP